MGRKLPTGNRPEGWKKANTLITLILEPALGSVVNNLGDRFRPLTEVIPSPNGLNGL